MACDQWKVHIFESLLGTWPAAGRIISMDRVMGWFGWLHIMAAGSKQLLLKVKTLLSNQRLLLQSRASRPAYAYWFYYIDYKPWMRSLTNANRCANLSSFNYCWLLWQSIYPITQYWFFNKWIYFTLWFLNTKSYLDTFFCFYLKYIERISFGWWGGASSQKLVKIL